MTADTRVDKVEKELDALKLHFNESCDRRADSHKKELKEHQGSCTNDVTTLHERVNKQWLQGVASWFAMLLIVIGGLNWLSDKMDNTDQRNINLMKDIASTHQDVAINKANINHIVKSVDRLSIKMDEHLKEIKEYRKEGN